MAALRVTRVILHGWEFICSTSRVSRAARLFQYSISTWATSPPPRPHLGSGHVRLDPQLLGLQQQLLDVLHPLPDVILKLLLAALGLRSVWYVGMDKP